MVGIAMDSCERDSLRKRLLKKVVRQILDLFVRSGDIKREYYPVVRPATFASLVIFKRCEVILDVLYFLFESQIIRGFWFCELSIRSRCFCDSSSGRVP